MSDERTQPHNPVPPAGATFTADAASLLKLLALPVPDATPLPDGPTGTLEQSPDDQARAAAASTEPVPPGLAVPGYELLEELGRGGMGVVYKARQFGLNRTVALKMLLAGPYADPAARVRFLVEAESVAALEHPHVVRVFAFGEHAGHPFLAMEHLSGGTLAERVMDGGPLPAGEAAGVVAKLAGAVSHAHARGVVHRDIKPANVLLTADGEPRLSDFGLAKVDRSDLTGTGAILGTPAYMSPEQAGGETKNVGAAADVYALGAVLYHLLTGRPPFRGDTPAATLRRVQETEPEPPRRLNPSVPRDLEAVCLKCLEKNPGRRYADAQALAADLHRFLAGEPTRARPAGVVERAARWARRHRAPVTLALWLLLLQVGIAIALYHLLPGSQGDAAGGVPGQDAPAAPPPPRAVAEPRAPQYRALLIGCTDYQGVAPDLPDARLDVRALWKLFRKRYGFPEEGITAVAGAVTKETIRAHFAELAGRAGPGDQVVISLIGHGYQPPRGEREQRAGFVPSQSPEAVGRFLKSQKLADLEFITPDESQQWVKAITDKGAFVWVIYDSNYGGQIGIAATPPRHVDGVLKLDFPNAVVMYACGRNERSWESATFGGGLFTGTLCEVLWGDDAPPTYGELLHVVREKVRERAGALSDAGRPVTQTPWIAGGNRGGLVLGGKRPLPAPEPDEPRFFTPAEHEMNPGGIDPETDIVDAFSPAVPAEGFFRRLARQVAGGAADRRGR